MKLSSDVEINLIGFISWYSCTLIWLMQSEYILTFFLFMGTIGYLYTVCEQLKELKKRF